MWSHTPCWNKYASRTLQHGLKKKKIKKKMQLLFIAKPVWAALLDGDNSSSSPADPMEDPCPLLSPDAPGVVLWPWHLAPCLVCRGWGQGSLCTGIWVVLGCCSLCPGAWCEAFEEAAVLAGSSWFYLSAQIWAKSLACGLCRTSPRSCASCLLALSLVKEKSKFAYRLPPKKHILQSQRAPVWGGSNRGAVVTGK